MDTSNLELMLAFPPQREGFSFALYRHPLTNLYQWINDIDFAAAFGMIQIYPIPVVVAGFGYSSFGRAPFGS